MAARSARRRHRLDLGDEDFRLLVLASERFGLPQSELFRRLLRGALDAGPALSASGEHIVAAAGSDIRAASRTFARIGLAIEAGEATGLRELGPVVDLLHRRLSALEGELTAMTLGHGRRLRRAAGLEEGAGSRDGSDALAASARHHHDA